MLCYSFRKAHILNKVISCWQKSIVLLLCLHHDGRHGQIKSENNLFCFVSSSVMDNRAHLLPKVHFQKKSNPHLRSPDQEERFLHNEALVLCLRTRISQARPAFMGKNMKSCQLPCKYNVEHYHGSIYF